MDDSDLALLEKFKTDQKNFFAGIKKTESLLLILCKTVENFPVYNKWWVENSKTRFKEGSLMLAAAASPEVDDAQLLHILKEREKGVVENGKVRDDQEDQGTSTA